MNKTWNVTANDSYYKVSYDGKKLSINGGDLLPLRKFKKKAHALETEYFIPVGNETAVLHISNRKKVEPVLTLGGIDCMTGQSYQMEKAPGWVWGFVVLYVINFIFILGGAVGGALSSACSLFSILIASDRKKNIVLRVLLCVAIYIVVTAVSVNMMLSLAPAIY